MLKSPTLDHLKSDGTEMAFSLSLSLLSSFFSALDVFHLFDFLVCDVENMDSEILVLSGCLKVSFSSLKLWLRNSYLLTEGGR